MARHVVREAQASRGARVILYWAQGRLYAVLLLGSDPATLEGHWIFSPETRTFSS
jgi:hypothetical protein